MLKRLPFLFLFLSRPFSEWRSSSSLQILERWTKQNCPRVKKTFEDIPIWLIDGFKKSSFVMSRFFISSWEPGRGWLLMGCFMGRSWEAVFNATVRGEFTTWLPDTRYIIIVHWNFESDKILQYNNKTTQQDSFIAILITQ